MYRVELDGVTLYDPRLKDYDIFTPKLKLEVNKAGAFDFRIYPSHPLYNRIFKLKSIVEVYQDDTLLFRGRVLDDEMDFNKSKMVICEGELAYFNDSVLRPYEFTGSVSNYLKLIVDQHNSQVQSNRRFTLGRVTVTDPNNLIVRADSTYPKTWDVVQSKLIKLLGGYLMIRRENGINYLDYLSDSNKISLQKIELGKNLLDLATQSSASDVYTAILPLGAEIDSDTNERLTIKSVNGGKDFIQDDDAVEKYGFIMQVGDWKDVTIASNLLTKARQELAQLIKLSLTLELTAIDLSMIDVDIDDFRVFEYVDVLSAPHGIDERLLVEKMEINLTSPDSNKITIGQQKKSLTDTQIETDKALGNVQIIKGPPGKDGEKGDKGDKGDQGIQGIKGEDGANGVSQYVHIRYSVNADGNPMTTTPQANTQYIGLTNTTSPTAPATNASYTWSKFKGDQGNQGIQGAQGANGKPTYTWVRYADDDKGTGISDSPDGKLYIGLAFNKGTATESNVSSDYTWSLMPQNIEVGGRNYFIQREAEDNKVLRWMFGDAIEEIGSLLSGFIPVLPSDNFLTSHKTNQRAFYNKDFEFLASSMHAIELEIKIPSYSEMIGSAWNLPEVTPIDTEPAFMRIAFRNDFLSKYDRKTVYVQKGTKATDWMPAPEDIEAELNDKADNEYVDEIVTTLNTTIEEMAGLIRTEVNETYTEKSEFSTYQESVSTEFQQTKEAFDFTFKDLITQIETLDGETQAQFEEIVKYIRFVDGNIVLGQVGNELELKIKHDRIQFLQNGVEVAFFSNNQFSVTDGEFINSLKLGNFAFMPRENGSLDFKKVVS